MRPAHEIYNAERFPPKGLPAMCRPKRPTYPRRRGGTLLRRLSCIGNLLLRELPDPGTTGMRARCTSASLFVCSQQQRPHKCSAIASRMFLVRDQEVQCIKQSLYLFYRPSVKERARCLPKDRAKVPDQRFCYYFQSNLSYALGRGAEACAK